MTPEEKDIIERAEAIRQKQQQDLADRVRRFLDAYGGLVDEFGVQFVSPVEDRGNHYLVYKQAGLIVAEVQQGDAEPPDE